MSVFLQGPVRVALPQGGYVLLESGRVLERFLQEAPPWVIEVLQRLTALAIVRLEVSMAASLLRPAGDEQDNTVRISEFGRGLQALNPGQAEMILEEARHRAVLYPELL